VERRRGVVPKCVAAMRAALACLALALFVVGCGGDSASEAVKPAEEPEERTFRPVKIVAACIAAVERPGGGDVLLADEKAEAFREFLGPLGFSCVSNEAAPADAKFDVVFVAGREGPEALRRAFGKVADGGILVWRLDVKDMTAESFKRCIGDFPCGDAHLWMQSFDEWTFVGRRAASVVKMDAMMDVFAREGAFELLAEAKATALSDVFASYVGSLSDTADAFKGGDLSVKIRPEFFVTREIPKIDWIERGDVDEDIYRETLAEMRSMQVVRRLVIQGSLTAEKGEEENADAATEIWSRAFRRNPRDPMLLDRLDRLARNAGALIRMGNLAAAAKCYETMIVINPTDGAAVFNYGICLKRLGKKEMSEQVLERAKELNK
jgi:tetratricopeptide (TPR) repeat protein